MITDSKYSWEKNVLRRDNLRFLAFFMLMFIPVVLAVLTRNKRQMWIPKQYVLGC